MNPENESPKVHLFICTNHKQDGSGCAEKGALELRNNLKEKCKAKWGKDVKITKSGCLGHCQYGVACVIYPKGLWYLKQTPQDEEKLLQIIEESLKD